MGKSFAFLLVNLCATSAVSFEGGIYSGLQVNIREDLDTGGCREVLENLQVRFKIAVVFLLLNK